MKLNFVANFPYKGEWGKGIWHEFGEGAGYFLDNDDYILVNAFYFLEDGNIQSPKILLPILEEVWKEHSSFPRLNVIIDFGKAFQNHLKITQITSSQDFLVEAKKFAEKSLDLVEIWRPNYFTSIDVPTIKPPHVKVPGGRRKPLVKKPDEALQLNDTLIQLYRNLLSTRALPQGVDLLMSLQGDPQKPKSYQDFLENTGWIQGSAGYSVGSLTEIKISFSWSQLAIYKQMTRFANICKAVVNELEELSLKEKEFHLHLMGSGAFMKLPVITYAFYDFAKLSITTDLQTPVKRASGYEYLYLERCDYNRPHNNKVSQKCNCKVCEKIKKAPYDRSILKFIKSQDGMELFSPEDFPDVTLRQKGVLLMHNILTHKIVAAELNKTKKREGIIETSRELFRENTKILLGLERAFEVLQNSRFSLDYFLK